MSSMYFLAFAFLASTSILFLLWHCRVSRARAQERRRLETQDSLDDATLAAVASAAAAAAAVVGSDPPVPRGAPLLLVRSLPTFVWGSKQNATGENGSEADTLGAGGSVNLGYCDVELGLCAADQRCGADVRAPSSEGDVESAEKLRRQKEWRDRRSVDAEQAGASRTAGAAQPHGGWDHQHQHAQQVQQVQQDGQRRRGGNRTPPCSWAAADAGSSSGDDDGAGSSVTEVADAEECSICLCGYADGDVLKQLPCRHSFHSSCIDTWLRNHSPTCPLCKHQLWEANPLSVQHALAGYLELLSLRRQQDEARVRRATERQTREHVASAPDVPAPRSPPAPAAVFGGVLSGARAAAAAAAAAAARAEAQAGASGGDFR